MQFIIHNNSNNKKAIKISTTKATKASTTLGQYIRFRLNNSYVHKYMHGCVWVCDNFHMPCAILICLRALGKSDAHVESQHTLLIQHVGYLQCSRRFQVINFFINSYTGYAECNHITFVYVKVLFRMPELFPFLITSSSFQYTGYAPVEHSCSCLLSFHTFFYWILLVLLYSYLKYFCLHANLCKYLQTKKRRRVCVRKRKRATARKREQYKKRIPFGLQLVVERERS